MSLNTIKLLAMAAVLMPALAIVAFHSNTVGAAAVSRDDAATTYKAKCAMCHGPNGEGKIGPALKGTKVGEDDIIAMLSKGKEGKKAPHTKPVSGLTEAQAKAVAHYVKSLK